MSRVKSTLRVGGTIMAAIGILCLPVGFGTSPKRDTSAFSNLADLGAFFRVGLMMIAVGLVALAISRVIPGDADW
jgi:hypothetical protein